MLSRLVANLLTSRLGKYLSGLDTLTVALWSGQIHVSNVQVRSDLFHHLDLPFDLVSGVVGRLEVTVPWTKLTSESVRIELHDLILLVRPLEKTEWMYLEKTYVEGILSRLERWELRLRNEYQHSLLSGDDQDRQNSYIHQISTSVLSRLKVSITNIHFRVLLPYHTRQAALGLKLHQVTISSADILENDRKKVVLTGFLAYCDTEKDASYRPNTNFEENLKELQGITVSGVVVNLTSVEIDIKSGVTWNLQGEIEAIIAESDPEMIKVIVKVIENVANYKKFMRKE